VVEREQVWSPTDLSFCGALCGKGNDPRGDGDYKGDEEDGVSEDVAWLQVVEHGDGGDAYE
jgi:hypothetical protein